MGRLIWHGKVNAETWTHHERFDYVWQHQYQLVLYPGRQPKKKTRQQIKSTQSEIDVNSPRTKRDKTWIPTSTHSEHGVGQTRSGNNSRLEHWLNNVDAQRGVTPSCLSEPDNHHQSTHFSHASRQLGKGQLLLETPSKTTKKPLPPIRSSQAWTWQFSSVFRYFIFIQ